MDGVTTTEPIGIVGPPDGDLDRLAPAGGRRARRHPLVAFLVRRTLLGVVTLVVASFMIFLGTNALPGNVAQAVLGKNATPALVHKLDRELKLDEPLLQRYGDWLGGLAQGDLGKSAVAVAQGDPTTSVATIIRTPLLNSLVIAVIATVLLFPLSLLVGTFAAVRAGRTADYTISYTSLIFGSLPEFVLGTFLIVIFFSLLDLFPPVALVSPGTSPLDHSNELVLPVLTLLGVSLAFCARQVRAGVLSVLGEDFVKMARLSGLGEPRVIWRYALRNALAPSVQTFAQALQYLFGGIIVVESLFAYPGIGQALVQAVTVRDVTEIQGITIVLAAVYIAINILADLLVILLVPKLRTAR